MDLKSSNTLMPEKIPQDVAAQSAHFNAGDYKLLQVYAYYRTLLSAVLLMMFTIKVAPQLLGSQHPLLFLYTLLIYTTTNVIALILLWQREFHPYSSHVISILVVDICTLVVLLYASGGANSSMGYLLLICIAAGGIFLKAKVNLAIAGFASILVLLQSLLSYFSRGDTDRELFNSAVLGTLLFATALVFSTLSERIRKSTQEAITKAEHAAYLEKLAQLIIERMRTGILVVDNNLRIVLVNHAAQTLLGYRNEDVNQRSITDLEPLHEHLRLWRAYPHTRSPHIKTSANGPEVRVSFAQLEPHRKSDTLVFVEDNRMFSQEAQQLKLASLGRLTASIAHEVRNPLAAISHAAQLLLESPDIPSADARLTEIIQNHSRRVNQIIENVLQLSRRRAAVPEQICFNEWLPAFTQEYNQSGEATIELLFENDDIRSRVDISQLEQILTNLCDNGLRYSEQLTGRRHLSIVAGVDINSELPYIEIIDDGPGIPDEQVQQVFEPFYTTTNTGSGLGLYICRELCEANQASLEYKRTPAGKSCFRINFAHPERIF